MQNEWRARAQERERGMYWSSYSSEDNELTRVFFELDGCKEEWARCDNDVILFDTKFGTNAYGMKLGLFVCVSCTGRTVVLAVVLIMNEDVNSFGWSFDRLADCLRRPPSAFFTDGCLRMDRAIRNRQVDGGWLQHTTHLLCVFHLSKNFHKHLRPLFGADKEEWKRCLNLFWRIAKDTDHRRQDDFDADFKEIEDMIQARAGASAQPQVEDVDEQLEELCDDGADAATKRMRWLHNLKVRKKKWAYRFTMEIFTAGCHSTARGESANSMMATLLENNKLITKLAELIIMHNFQSRRKGEIEQVALFNAHAKQLEPLPVVKSLHQKISEYAYHIVLAQCAQAMQYALTELSTDEAQLHAPTPVAGTSQQAHVYRVQRIQPVQSQPSGFVVDEHGFMCEFDHAFEYGLQPSGKDRITHLTGCSCQFPRCFGLPCRHMIRAYVQAGVHEFPVGLIHPKWLEVTDSVIIMRTRQLMTVPRPCQRATMRSSTSLTQEDMRALLLQDFQSILHLVDNDSTFSYCRAQALTLRNLLLSGRAPVSQAPPLPPTHFAYAQAMPANVDHANLPTAEVLLPVYAAAPQRKRARTQPSTAGAGRAVDPSAASSAAAPASSGRSRAAAPAAAAAEDGAAPASSAQSRAAGPAAAAAGGAAAPASSAQSRAAVPAPAVAGAGAAPACSAHSRAAGPAAAVASAGAAPAASARSNAAGPAATTAGGAAEPASTAQSCAAGPAAAVAVSAAATASSTRSRASGPAAAVAVSAAATASSTRSRAAGPAAAPSVQTCSSIFSEEALDERGIHNSATPRVPQNPTKSRRKKRLLPSEGGPTGAKANTNAVRQRRPAQASLRQLGAQRQAPRAQSAPRQPYSSPAGSRASSTASPVASPAARAMNRHRRASL